jgi:uncharacterized protein
VEPDSVRNGGCYSRMRFLPPGGVVPAGWLADYARVNAHGWTLRYAENRDTDVYGKFWNRNPAAKITFDANNVTQVLCDYTAYFADSMLHYASLFPDSPLARHADEWVARLLASQDPDGYIGAFVPAARWQHWLEVLSQSLVEEALLHRYERDGNPALLEACERMARLQMAAWYRPRPGSVAGIWGGHGTIVIRSLLKLYSLTADAAYLRFAGDVMEANGRMRDFLGPRDALENVHNAIGTEHVGLPALLYEYSGEPSLLMASVAAWEMEEKNHLSVDGTPHGNENMLFKGPLHNCEHCGTVEWIYASNALARVTGEVRFADAAERALLNAYPAAKTTDGMAVAYMHTPNQLVASEWSQPHAWTSPDWCASRQHYSSAHEPACCNANGPRGLTHLIESMAMSIPGGLAIVYYGAFRARAAVGGRGWLECEVDSTYPFEDEARVEIREAPQGACVIAFRIPGWCRAASVTVNGDPVAAETVPGTYLRLERGWRAGDRIVVRFTCPVTLDRWDRSEFGIRAGAVVVKRGALTFALPVAEDWQPFVPPARGPGKDCVAYRVLPAQGACWSYALVLPPGSPETGFTPVRLDVQTGSAPWTNPPLGLRVKARRVLNWPLEGDPEHPRTPLMPFNPLKLDAEVVSVTLVPFGFTHLRMAYLPVAETGSAACP